jgi:hypothetical protein
MSHFLNSPVFTGNVTAPTLNNLTLTAIATGFTLAGGTTSKTLTVSNTLTLQGTDNSILNIGTGGTLGSAAYQASTAFEPALGNPGTNGWVLSSTTSGVRSWVAMTAGFTNPMTTLGDIMYENATPAAARLAGNTSTTMAVLTQTGTGTASAAPVWTLINSNNGICGLDGTGKVALAQLPASIVGGMNYQGTWNASTNSPTLVNGTGTKGYYYKVSVAGNTTIDGNNNWSVGDIIAFDGTTWDKIEGGSPDVISVNGQTGAVTVAAVDQSFFLGTTSLKINASSGTQTVLAGMTSITSTTFVGTLSGNATGFTGNLTGDVTSTGMTTTLSAATVVSKTLTGFALGTDSTQLAATDTILQAFQKLQYQGNLNLLPTQTKSATYNPTLVTDKCILCDATNGAFTITLLAAPVTNQCMTFKKIDATNNAITINGNGKNIDGAASFTLTAQWNAITIVYNGTAWYII